MTQTILNLLHALFNIVTGRTGHLKNAEAAVEYADAERGSSMFINELTKKHEVVLEHVEKNLCHFVKQSGAPWIDFPLKYLTVDGVEDTTKAVISDVRIGIDSDLYYDYNSSKIHDLVIDLTKIPPGLNESDWNTEDKINQSIFHYGKKAVFAAEIIQITTKCSQHSRIFTIYGFFKSSKDQMKLRKLGHIHFTKKITRRIGGVKVDLTFDSFEFVQGPHGEMEGLLPMILVRYKSDHSVFVIKSIPL